MFYAHRFLLQAKNNLYQSILLGTLKLKFKMQLPWFADSWSVKSASPNAQICSAVVQMFLICNLYIFVKCWSEVFELVQENGTAKTVSGQSI